MTEVINQPIITVPKGTEKLYQKLLDFDAAVRSYEINPNLIRNIDEIEKTYSSYRAVKGETNLPEDWKKFEKDLIGRCGGRLQ
ncbi:MAG: hypothetical protein PHQ66_03820 [Candidatus Nanoarchaeia archaeon]|nr:hypothetical protein [Candidatus Nanoarchaeia archaeon]MDD5358189.1 hypothetical protein [Candidatus Nanoarchaeia archaeon]MDD5589455.1 hypothetical protein [Candidatus Nanoarchaeia archaeon]